MPRVRVPEEVQTAVLVLSRRRCAFCYGLNNDQEVKDGQIAHINRNASDNRQDNLAFLCLLHHDQYDAKRSQSKGLTENELRTYRNKLYEQFNKEESPKRSGLFSEYSDLIPEKWRHIFEEALEFYTGPHRTQSAVLSVLDGPMSLAEIAERIPPFDVSWTEAIVKGAVARKWLQATENDPITYTTTVRARVLLEALADIPEAVKDDAVKAIWFSP